ncbi:ROK family protein [Duganella sp. BJB488]|uniref:ROK family protein n=1 Tax=unclassified Duganella TaxID=2636909 RepID=UPI000E345EB6|nr:MULTISPECIES: ROK family protein [unclassified Duganella]RFP15348.1 ROK family protein [Duganella sp. BJB489]RFP19904.1 ROK family protein [Duganella sp. BJB488]RFP38292.1 ROK family protein [Duganella sp. BJB480]
MTNSEPRGYHGIDIGGTKIELVAFADNGHELKEVHRERIATPGTDFAEFLLAIQGLVGRADKALGLRAPVGVGLPGVIDSATGRQLSSNVPALNGRAVAHALKDALERPVAIGNDCQCFALSEAHGGAAHGQPTMFGAIIGTGAGGGYCVDGRLLRGANGVAGEWGHWPLPASQFAAAALPVLDCPCGRRGCLERYVSGPGMSRLHLHLGGGDETPAAIVAQARAGSAIAAKTMALHADLLGHALATLVLTLDPHAIVLGGGLSQLAHLYDQLPAAMRRHLFPGVRVPPILPPKFGDAGGARGAALLARQQFATP